MATLSTIILAAGLGLSAAGAGISYVGQQRAQKATAEAANANLAQQREIERQRRRQMELEANRARRNTVRQAIAARSQAMALAANRGVGSGSSVLGGVEGSIAGREGNNVLAINQNAEIGGRIFDINSQYSGVIGNAYRSAASGNTMASLGSGFTSIGGAMMQNNVTLAKVGTSLGNVFS